MFVSKYLETLDKLGDTDGQEGLVRGYLGRKARTSLSSSIAAIECDAAEKLFLTGRTEEALLRAESAAKREPESAQAHFMHAQMLFRLARVEEAKEAIGTAMKHARAEEIRPIRDFAFRTGLTDSHATFTIHEDGTVTRHESGP